MATSTDFQQEYQQAEAAYLEGNYSEAAALVYQLVEAFPEDPSARLLCGHIYCYGLQQYDVAREQYAVVLGLTDDPDFMQHANEGIAYTEQFLSGEDSSGSEALAAELDLGAIEEPDLSLFGGDETFALGEVSAEELDDPDLTADLGLSGLDLEDNYNDDLTLATPFNNPFSSEGSGGIGAYAEAETEALSEASASFEDPFALDSEFEEGADLDFAAGEETAAMFSPAPSPPPAANGRSSPDLEAIDLFDDGFADLELPDKLDLEMPASPARNGSRSSPANNSDLSNAQRSNSTGRRTGSDQSGASDLGQSGYSVAEDETLLMGGARPSAADLEQGNFSGGGNSARSGSNSRSGRRGGNGHSNGFDVPESFDFDAFDDDAFSDSFAFDDDPGTAYRSGEVSSAGGDSDFAPSDFTPSDFTPSTRQNIDFLDDFDEFDDLGNVPDFDISEDSSSSLLTSGNTGFGMGSGVAVGTTASNLDFGDNSDGSAIRDDEIFSISGPADAVPTFTPAEVEPIDTSVTVEQGSLAFLENAPLLTKQLYTAIGAGLASLIAVAVVSYAASTRALEEQKPEVIGALQRIGGVMTLVAGASSFLTAWGVGNVVARQVHRSTDDLQAQFDLISQGKLEARATVYSEDEFGKMAAKFNHMGKVILTTTSDARRKAEEQEQAKEDLQRQVIRLLDDVEGAARGDLTVQAEVTADVLGAVADSFNLTIQNLREIVFQVKSAAREVSKGATDSATFAQGLSSDALRQAEELAATLNSVQVLTDAIQRVAENAREAEEVARSASATAVKGGEAVERTVAGILEIRETVAETTRKVKRLAEASQEISKIVALIATIASRTNLLALNASIEAARAGEAGRGFAIVADEVRQLADRSAKSLKEIEQIVMQIQSETGAVMTAMEEGTQQVIEGTRLAEQAKRSLEDIIQVSNRIDVLVRSITADTVEQNETARAVAQVMQAVELTAQETSQESQRVYGSLQNLVGVARDLLTSVERFRVETGERQ